MMYGSSSHDAKSSGYKWRALAAAVAASLGLALLIAVLILLITNPKVTGGGDEALYMGRSGLDAGSPVIDAVGGDSGGEQLSIYRPVPPRFVLKVPTPVRPSTTTQAPVPAPVAVFSSSSLDSNTIYASSTPPPSPQDKSVQIMGRDGPSPMSMALLVSELLLVHDVQRLLRHNDTSLMRALVSDEEALALSSLFLPPGRVREFLEAREKGGTVELKAKKRSGGWIGDARELIVDGVRLGGNIWKAYVEDSASNGGKTALQCIWTLYCRNLEKMGSLRGPFGLAGRMNGLGLRLAMKDAGAEDVFNFVAREMHAMAMEKLLDGEFGGHMMVLERVLEVGLGMKFRSRRDEQGGVLGGGVGLDCPRLFPRCSPLEAPPTIIKLVLDDKA